MNSLTTQNSQGEERDSIMCQLCICYGQKVLSHFEDKEIGPVCADCKNETIRADLELRWAFLGMEGKI